MIKKKNTPVPCDVLAFLRTRAGLSQNQLARQTELQVNDISRFERGHYGRVSKYRTLAKFFHVSVDDLARNNLAGVAASMKEKQTPQHRLQKSFRIRQERQIEIGCAGEDVVTAAEHRHLAGTRFENAVTPGFADMPSAGHDILSFTPAGVPRYIEVKATSQEDPDTPFYMTSGELDFLEECRRTGKLYELHRVYGYKDEDHWSREVYTPKDLEEYEFIPTEYMVRRKRK